MKLLSVGRSAPSGNERFYPLDPTSAAVQAHHPLALAILADYGNPADRAAQVSAIVDWVARTAIHGHSGLRLPQPYTKALGTLPVGETWATVQGKLSGTQQNTDNAYWLGFRHDGAAILAKLIGTLNADGTRANDGAMVRVTDDGSQAHYRYRDLASIKSIWCTHQHNICILLLASLGYPSMLCHITGHDPLRVQYGERGEWGYWCSTYNEHFVKDGGATPLDLLTMRDLTQSGQVARIVRATHAGPVWDSAQYGSASYMVDHPDGVPQCGVSLDSRIIGGLGSRMTRVLDDPALSGSGHALENYTRVADTVARPYLGAYLYGTVPGDGQTIFRVASGWPGTVGFQARVNGGVWNPVTASTLLDSGTLTCTLHLKAGRLEVAPVDANGHLGPSVDISV